MNTTYRGDIPAGVDAQSFLAGTEETNMIVISDCLMRLGFNGENIAEAIDFIYTLLYANAEVKTICNGNECNG